MESYFFFLSLSIEFFRFFKSLRKREGWNFLSPFLIFSFSGGDNFFRDEVIVRIESYSFFFWKEIKGINFTFFFSPPPPLFEFDLCERTITRIFPFEGTIALLSMKRT